jgi:hypothetical protein
VKDIGARDIIIGGGALLIACLLIYTTAVMTLNIAKRNQDSVVANAVSSALDKADKPALTCVESRLIENVKSMAENGIHLKGYKVKIEIGNIPESDPWN